MILEMSHHCSFRDAVIRPPSDKSLGPGWNPVRLAHSPPSFSSSKFGLFDDRHTWIKVEKANRGNPDVSLALSRDKLLSPTTDARASDRD